MRHGTVSSADPSIGLRCNKTEFTATCEARCSSNYYEVTRKSSGTAPLKKYKYCLACPQNAVCENATVKYCTNNTYKNSYSNSNYSGLYECKACPASYNATGKTKGQATSISDCYIQNNNDLEDDTGYFQFKVSGKEGCFYQTANNNLPDTPIFPSIPSGSGDDVTQIKP